MAGRTKITARLIDLDDLRTMYLDKSIRMHIIAKRFGYTPRRIHQFIVEQRELEPEKWPYRYAQN